MAFAALSGLLIPPALAQSVDPSGDTYDVLITGRAPDATAPEAIARVPSNAQEVTARQISASHATDMGAVLSTLAGSIGLNDTQGNAFQPDVNFRGFSASPVLGTAEGVAVQLEGVRLNENFGDVVYWDLIPTAAIARITVLPGTDPGPGPNALGGALLLTTKSGLDWPGSEVEIQGGSFQRRSMQAMRGGAQGAIDYFASATVQQDQGPWAQSPSRLQQGFARLGYREGVVDLGASLLVATTHLEGSQTMPQSWLEAPQPYTWPDVQDNRLAGLNLSARRQLTARSTLSAMASLRALHTTLLNSNVNGQFDPSASPAPGNSPTENERGLTDATSTAFSAQWAWARSSAAHAPQLTAGLSLDHGASDYAQFSQSAGASRNTASAAPWTLSTRLRSTRAEQGYFASGRVPLGAATELSIAVRANRAEVQLTDRLGTTLNGRSRFARLNPALGLLTHPSRTLAVFASYGEGMRGPSPIELACADAATPCALPNAFAADPPLRAVVSKSGEAGVRGALGAHAHYSAGVFRTTLYNDIQFISAGSAALQSGYFSNVGDTRRQGLELALDARSLHWSVTAHYTYLEATYRSVLLLNSPANSSAAALSCAGCAQTLVMPGASIPGNPRHSANLRLAYQPSTRWSVALEGQGQSSQFARGDENNADVRGPVPGSVRLGLQADWRLAAHWRLWGRADNLLDCQGASFGVLGQNVFTGPGRSYDLSGETWRPEQFRSLLAPRGLWIGITYSNGGSATP